MGLETGQVEKVTCIQCDWTRLQEVESVRPGEQKIPFILLKNRDTETRTVRKPTFKTKYVSGVKPESYTKGKKFRFKISSYIFLK